MAPCRVSSSQTKHKGCCIEGCGVTYPGYEIKGTNLKFCSTHRTPSCVSKYSPCSYLDCNNFRPRFISQGKLFCHIHKPIEATEIKKKCYISACENTRRYNYPGLNPLYCYEHRQSEMVPCYVQKLCDYVGCGFAYAYKNLEHKRCLNHKTSDMIPRLQCTEKDCSLYARWHHIGQASTKCFTHREPEMILNSFCVSEGCYRRRYYNFPNQPPMYCSDHITNGMINVSYKQKPELKMLKQQYCHNDDCMKTKHYGYVTLPRTRCSEHREPGMIRKNTLCKFPSCKMEICSREYCHLHCGDDEQIHRFPCVKCQKLHYVADINTNLVCYSCEPFSISLEESESIAKKLYSQRPNTEIISTKEKSLAIADRYMMEAFSHRIDKIAPNTYLLKPETSKVTNSEVTNSEVTNSEVTPITIVIHYENAIQEVLDGNSRLVNIYGLRSKQIAKKLSTVGN